MTKRMSARRQNNDHSLSIWCHPSGRRCAKKVPRGKEGIDHNMKSSRVTTLSPIYLEYRTKILSLKPDETFTIQIQGRDEFEAILGYLSDLFKPKGDRKRGSYTCRLNEIFFKRARIRGSKQSRLMSGVLCQGKLKLASDHSVIVVQAHSAECSRQFTRFPQVLTHHLDRLLAVQLRTCHPRMARAMVAEHIKSSEFKQLIPPTQDLAQYLRNRCRKLEFRGTLNEVVISLLQTIITKGFVLVLSMDCIRTTSGVCWLNILFRSPDTLCFLVLAQALVKRDDLDSKRQFLTWVRSKLPHLSGVVFVRHLNDIEIIKEIFPNCSPFLWLVEVIHGLTKRLPSSLHQVARKCVRTKSRDKFEEACQMIGEAADAPFWQYSCLWSRLMIVDPVIRMAASQDIMVTDRNQTFRGFVKAQREQDIASVTASWNLRHEAALQTPEERSPTTGLLVYAFEQTPPVFRPIIRQTLRSHLTISDVVGAKYEKMFPNAQACLDHQCKTLLALGMICKHFLFLINGGHQIADRQALFLDPISPLNRRIASYRGGLMALVSL